MLEVAVDQKKIASYGVATWNAFRVPPSVPMYVRHLPPVSLLRGRLKLGVLAAQLPARPPPVNASADPLRVRPHDSGPPWFRYSFVVENFHLLHYAGFYRRFQAGTPAGEKCGLDAFDHQSRIRQASQVRNLQIRSSHATQGVQRRGDCTLLPAGQRGNLIADDKEDGV